MTRSLTSVALAAAVGACAASPSQPTLRPFDLDQASVAVATADTLGISVGPAFATPSDARAMMALCLDADLNAAATRRAALASGDFVRNPASGTLYSRAFDASLNAQTLADGSRACSLAAGAARPSDGEALAAALVAQIEAAGYRAAPRISAPRGADDPYRFVGVFALTR